MAFEIQTQLPRMAEVDVTTNWPGPVTFNDDDPKRGFASVYLSVPNLGITKGGIFGKAKPKEGVLVDPCFDDGVIKVKVTMNGNGTEQIYEYKKNALEDIDPKRCEILYRDKRVIVKLAKVVAKSWAAHARYYIERPE